MGVKANKTVYYEKLKGYLEDYKSIFVVSVDHVCTPGMIYLILYRACF